MKKIPSTHDRGVINTPMSTPPVIGYSQPDDDQPQESPGWLSEVQRLSEEIQQLRVERSSSANDPVIPPPPRHRYANTNARFFPQENGRYLCALHFDLVGSSSLDAPRFELVGYGDTEVQALIAALQSLITQLQRLGRER
jgi:hypothetical protein